MMTGENSSNRVMDSKNSTKFPSLSVFFPAYNDAASLPRLLENTFFAVLGPMGRRLRSDRGQRMGAATRPLEVRRTALCRVVRKQNADRDPCREQRLWRARLQSGFPPRARKRLPSFTPMAMGQYDVTELPRLLELVEPRDRFSERIQAGPARSGHIASGSGNVYNFCARMLFFIRIRDIDCDYRLIRRDLLEKIHLTSTSGTICVELVRKLELSGCQVVRKSPYITMNGGTGSRSSFACGLWRSRSTSCYGCGCG